MGGGLPQLSPLTFSLVRAALSPDWAAQTGKRLHENFQDTQTQTERGIRQGGGSGGGGGGGGGCLHERESMHAPMYDCMYGTYAQKREREREIANVREISEALCRLVGLNLGLDSDLEVYLS